MLGIVIRDSRIKSRATKSDSANSHAAALCTQVFDSGDGVIGISDIRNVVDSPANDRCNVSDDIAVEEVGEQLIDISVRFAIRAAGQGERLGSSDIHRTWIYDVAGRQRSSTLIDRIKNVDIRESELIKSHVLRDHIHCILEIVR